MNIEGPFVDDHGEFRYVTSEGTALRASEIENDQFPRHVGDEEKNRSWHALQNFYATQGTPTTQDGFALGPAGAFPPGSEQAAYGTSWDYTQPFDWDKWKADRKLGSADVSSG